MDEGISYVTAIAGGASVLIGKIVWEYLRKPMNGDKPVTSKECHIQHEALSTTIKDMKDNQKTAFEKIDKIYDHLLDKK